MIIINAQNQILGRLATRIAKLLQTKNLNNYQPEKDIQLKIKIINARKIIFTGKKLQSKNYYHYSGYPGGMKKRKLKNLYIQTPEKLLKMTIKKMLPRNRLRTKRINNLIISR